MIEIKKYTGLDFQRLVESDCWTVAMLRYSPRFSNFEVLERHLMTDEVFVLLDGNATLYVAEDPCDVVEAVPMNALTIYNIPKNIWHHIVVSEDASVLVVENRDTTKENTERRSVSC